jgi:hypothetical protein
MARPRRPHMQNTKPTPAQVVVMKYSVKLYALALEIAAGNRANVKVLSPGRIEITNPDMSKVK